MIKKLVLFFSLITLSIESSGSHIFGGDLFYTWISGNRYALTLVIYGDCSGLVFPSLSTATAGYKIYNGTTLYGTFNMTIQAPVNGIEVTPVCPADINNTTCKGGPIPGITKFVYSDTEILGGASASWVFVFEGWMTNSFAGRSNSITNINFAGAGSVMELRDSLNNTGGPNSSPQFTTIPTPFFCINQPSNYNPGAVDKNGDSLTYQLVPGFDTAYPSGLVPYVAPFTATNPLSVTPSSQTFSSSTGQLSFTPNALQKSLVVEQVNEYRNGKLVGTSMREMTFVVLNCSEPATYGAITANSAGTIVDSTDFTICQSAGPFTFHIDPKNAGAANITVSSAGLPAGATYTVTGNGTSTLSGLFSWNASGVAPGKYTFFLTFLNDACPLSSKQTQAYTITILASPSLSYSLISPAICIKKAIFTVTNNYSPWTLILYHGSNFQDSVRCTINSINDSLAAGTYTLSVNFPGGCGADTTITLPDSVQLTSAIAVNEDVCYGGSSGVIHVSGIGGTGPYKVSLNGALAKDISFTFQNLTANGYALHISDSLQCVYDTFITITQPTPISIKGSTLPNPCTGLDTDGVFSVVVSGGTPPYLYLWSTGITDTIPTIHSLHNGTYKAIVNDDNDCKDSISAEVVYESCCSPFIPNAFTPNGDGKDETFKPLFRGDMQLIEFSIYNRYGQQVFTTKDISKAWDGTFNGIPQDLDTYFYYLRLYCGNSINRHIEALKGDVTLIR